MSKVRIGMVGCGGFQRYRLGNVLKIAEAEVVGLADTEPEQIAKTKEAHPALHDVPVYADYKEMVQAGGIDAIMIATPHTQHVDQILFGFEHGLNVLCEKPLVTSVADAHRVIQARDKSGKVGMVSYQRHFQAEFRYIREKIASGEAGAFQYVAALQGQGWLRGCRGTWRHQKSLSGGGQLNDSGSHLLDVILWVSQQKVDRVTAFADNFDTEVDINSALSVKFKSGALGTFSIVGNGIGWYEDVTFFCEEMIFYARHGKLTMVDRKENKLVCEHLAGGSTPDKNFVDAILGKAECESPLECGLEVIRLTEAAWQSAEQDGQVVPVTA